MRRILNLLSPSTAAPRGTAVLAPDDPAAGAAPLPWIDRLSLVGGALALLWVLPAGLVLALMGSAVLPTSAPSAPVDAAAATAVAPRPVLLALHDPDCGPCELAAARAFSDPRVRLALRDFTLIETSLDNGAAREGVAAGLLQRMTPGGRPGMLFFDAAGVELPDSRLDGFPAADSFLAHLAEVREQMRSQALPRPRG